MADSYLDRFYKWMGWDTKSAPPPKKLAEHAHRTPVYGMPGAVVIPTQDQMTEKGVRTNQRAQLKEVLHGATLDWDIALEKHILSAMYGKKYADQWEAAQLRQQRRMDPTGRAVADTAGMLLTAPITEGANLLTRGSEALAAAPRLAPIVARTAPAATRAREFLAPTGRFFARHPILEGAARGGVTGAGYGALQGAGEAGEGHRLEGAREGGETGFLFGAGLGTAGALGRELWDAIGVKGGWVDPEAVARRRLERTSRGQAPGSKTDVTKLRGKAARKATGGTGLTERTAPEIGVPVPVNDTVAGLTPGTDETVAQRAANLRLRARTNARENFREPWSTKVKLSAQDVNDLNLAHPDIKSIMNDIYDTQAGFRDEDFVIESKQHKADIDALLKYFKDRKEYEEAWARYSDPENGTLKKYQDELKKYNDPNRLSTPGAPAMARPVEPTIPVAPPPPEVSAGTLNLIASRAGRKATDLVGQSKSSEAGLFTRFNENIKKKIASIPGMSKAWEDYSHHLSRADAIEEMTKHIFEMNPRDFREFMSTLPIESREDARIALRDGFADILKNKTSASPLVNALNNDILTQNMNLILGPEENAAFARNAHTELEAGGAKIPKMSEDDAATGGLMSKLLFHQLPSAVGSLVDIANSIGMTREEAIAITRLTHGNPDLIMDVIEKQPTGAVATTLRNGMTRLATSYNLNPETLETDDFQKPTGPKTKIDEELDKLFSSPETAPAPTPEPAATPAPGSAPAPTPAPAAGKDSDNPFLKPGMYEPSSTPASAATPTPAPAAGKDSDNPFLKPGMYAQ